MVAQQKVPCCNSLLIVMYKMILIVVPDIICEFLSGHYKKHTYTSMLSVEKVRHAYLLIVPGVTWKT
jgi:hypothetical protein